MHARLGLLLLIVLSPLASRSVSAQPIVDLQVRHAQATTVPRPAPLLQLPAVYSADMVDPWRAERRARFMIAMGTGLALAGSTFLVAHPTMHRNHCTYHHSYGPAAGGIVTGVGLGLITAGALWLVRRHREQPPFRHNVLGTTLFVLGGALVGTVSTLWLESVDSDGCNPRIHAHI